MTKEDCYELGRIIKTHGLKGELGVFLDVDYPDEYEEIDSLFIEVKGQLVPYFIEEIQIRGNKAIVKFEDINTWEQAKPLVGLTLYLTLDNLPKLEDGQFFYHEIMQATVVDTQLGALGKVEDVYQVINQDIIVMTYQGKEVLIPVNDHTIGTFDRTLHQLHVNLPEGLLDVYLSE
ncbi:MAG: ribosome maturation factor RimM [Spirosomataceae bacterium]